ncbi:MAG TPA: hypothetical protein VGW74_05615 [Propionibacteriaceae bacterium]|nr:hypothetical protein [Propionibacteriaceae bacterium]
MAAPRMLKQWAAVIDGVTTIVCLDAAGQIREPDAPFDTLNGEFMHPPAHIHCRAIIVPWLPGFINTQRGPANAELARRPAKQRRKGPEGSTASVPPPDRSNPPGRRPPVPPVTTAARRRAREGASFEGGKVDPGEDVRRSEGLARVLSGPAGEFRPDPVVGDLVAAEIARQRAADGLPVLVTELGEGERLARYTDHGQQLRRGRYRAGLGVFGAGIAFWVLLEDDPEQEMLAAFGAERVAAELVPAARVVDLEELRRLQAAALTRLDGERSTAERERWRRVISDEGRFALLLGYDAIRVRHADGRVEVVVVNRGALIVEGS